ncbi:enoyl-CoA hydratase-related protein [Aquibacillus sp. 3ASR75-11]|uniref:Enoyl-CoA hydratase-related protein n=1 Tax=Terrihalobacillus insolitus TaxID=2950438 RepID=A0A9X4ANJ9_9BACI|nr:enoyl-CoA hydratase-related protein [Terrihalobacillus insolitus]MDC3415042.1 enoyl-CoA hydratase-related protein [Terrihalobacillus insolitus]MDC3425904.1 enoyl-CoA hydratase-related protein [Terrihalobacillus insolitus]
MSDIVNYERKNDHLVVITLNRPEAANALSHTLLDQLNEAVAKISLESDIRCVVITGAGERAFCAGADLKERQGMHEKDVLEAVTYIGDTINRIEQIQVPTIAAINGAAFGGGLELALACDIRIASVHAKMGLTETSLGIIPGAGGTQRLARLIGLGQAKRLIFTAESIDAASAFSLRLVERLSTKETLLQDAEDVANKITKNAPIALIQAKKAIHYGLQTDLQTGLTIEKMSYQATIPTKDRVEALEAFQQKRKPTFIGE